jgi:hypothetical protein
MPYVTVHIDLGEIVSDLSSDELHDLIDKARAALLRMGKNAPAGVQADYDDDTPDDIHVDVGERELCARLSGVPLSRHALYIARTRACLPL